MEQLLHRQERRDMHSRLRQWYHYTINARPEHSPSEDSMKNVRPILWMIADPIIAQLPRER